MCQQYHTRLDWPVEVNGNLASLNALLSCRDSIARMEKQLNECEDAATQGRYRVVSGENESP